MQVDVEVRGRSVLVVGEQRAARRVLRRFQTAEAAVTHLEPSDAAEVRLPALVGAAQLVVLVGGPDLLRRQVLALATRMRRLVVQETPASDTGGVTLVGGGPGRTSLLTVEAVAALREADIVFYDRLSPSDQLPELAPGAELYDVGKSPYRHPVTQREIEELMVGRARAGDQVVRLKGGDPFVFGRGGEEVQACLAAGIGVRVVPGVSSALAVPASAGIPVTHRGVSHCFTVLSGHVPPSQEEYQALTDLGGTLVLLMGVANLEQIVAGLGRAGMAADRPAAVIERGFSDSQRSTFTSLGELACDARRLGVGSPAVIVIGEVVAVAQIDPGAELLGSIAAWAAPHGVGPERRT